jgi:Putative addiction module component
MQTLSQLISEATALPDADKAILVDKIMESMAEPIDSRNERLRQRDILLEGVKKAQERLAEIDRGAVQTIPVTLTGLRGIAKHSGTAPSDRELQSEYTDYLTQKYQ